jgi:hypothetical protein
MTRLVILIDLMSKRYDTDQGNRAAGDRLVRVTAGRLTHLISYGIDNRKAGVIKVARFHKDNIECRNIEGHVVRDATCRKARACILISFSREGREDFAAVTHAQRVRNEVRLFALS